MTLDEAGAALQLGFLQEGFFTTFDATRERRA
jgi:hypothetical protein